MNELEAQLRQLMIELCALPADFSRDADFYLELGVPSVKAMELLMELEERFAASVPDDRFVEATTLARLSEMMESVLPSTHVG